MIKKKDLLKNLRKYTADQIAEAIRNNVVTLYELGRFTEGAFSPLLEREVISILKAPITTTKLVETPSTEEPQSSESKPMDMKRKAVEKENSKKERMEEREEVAPPLPIEQNIENEESQQSNNDYYNDEYDDTSSDDEETIYDQMPILASKQGMFSSPFSFKGRIRRTEYGISLIIVTFINFFMSLILNSDSEEVIILYFIILIPLVWFNLAQGAKRCHDLGNSGIFQLIPLYFFWMLFSDGDKVTNEYGISPK